MKTALGVTMAAAVLAAGVGWASAGTQPSGRQGGDRGQRMAEYLGLTEDQKATWATLREEHKAEMAPLREEGRALHDSLRSAMDAANPDPAAVGAATLAMKQHREKIKAAEDAFHTRLAGTLSDEQRTKFEALKAAHHGRRGQGFRGHGGHKRGAPDESSSVSPSPVVG
jgi:Spy/CpxP family protein refolding chaperone